MFKIKSLAVALFVTAFAVGGVFVGGAVQAQQADVSCSPAATSVQVGQSVTLSASGGDDGAYVWSSPGLTITDATGPNFVATFSVPGDYTVTVSNDGESDTCVLAVSATETIGGTITTTPGLPNTGELPY